jgi:hypothetical protein
MELECGVRHILRGIDQKKSIVAFPWQLSCLVRLVAAHLPASWYDWVVSRGLESGSVEHPEAAPPQRRNLN